MGEGPVREGRSADRAGGRGASRQAVRAAGAAQRRRTSKVALAKPRWTPQLAYAVGLIATDGGITRGRNLGFPSADRELVGHLLACLEKENKISRIRGRTGGIYYRTQIGDAAFCQWLMSIGIAERKSLTIGPLDVPEDHLFTVARGLLDGDGSIINKMARADVGRRNDYLWEYLQTKFVCGSRPHLEWLKKRLNDSLGIDGLIITRAPRGTRHASYTLRYGKIASHRLLPHIYRDTSAPRLSRKWRVWAGYVKRHPGLGLDKMVFSAQVVKR